MDKFLRVLFVEDSESDANLILRLLEKTDKKVISKRVETPDALRQSIDKDVWDIIICDHLMPGLDAEDALKIVQESGKDIPFIIVSGVIDEEYAARLMKKGAVDYLFKNNLIRLVPSIKRELKEAENRREKRRKDEALRVSEKLFSTVFRSSPIAITITRMSDGKFIELNDTVIKLLGYSRKELIGRTSVELGLYVNPDDRKRLIEELKAKGKVCNYETHFYDKKKNIIMTLQSLEIIDIEGEKCILSVYEDITERRKAEDKLKESEEQFRTLTSVSPVGIFECDPHGNIVYVNERWKKITGVGSLEIKGKNWMKMIYPDDRDDVMTMCKKTTESGTPCRKEYRFEHTDGKTIWVFCEILPEINASGQIKGFIGTLTDITESKMNEFELERILGEQNMIAETAVDLVSIKTSREMYMYLADRIKEIEPDIFALISSYDKKRNSVKILTVIGLENFLEPIINILGMNPFDIEIPLTDMTEDELARFSNLKLNYEPGGIYALAARKVPVLLCKAIEKLLGITAVFSIGFLWDNMLNGGVSFLVKNKESFLRFINIYEIIINQVSLYLQRITMEEHMHASEARYRRLFEAAKDGIFILDYETGNILDANPYICDILGYSWEELSGKKLWEIGVFDQKAISKEAFQILKNERYIRYEDIPLKAKNGQTIEVEFISNIYPVGDEKVIQCNIRDISERKLAENIIKQMAKFPLENPNPVIRIDGNGKVLFSNHAAQKNMDFSAEKLLRLGWREHIKECMESGNIKIVEQEINHKIFSLSFTPIPDTEYLNVYGVDITEKKRAEEAIKKDEARMEALLRISKYDAESIQVFLDYALEEVIKITGSQIGYIYFYNEDTKELILSSWSKGVMKECSIENPPSIYYLEKTGFWGEAVRQRKPIVNNDFQAPHPLKKGYPKGHAPLYRFVTIPVIFNDRIVAVVGAANKESDYTDTDIRQMILMMDTVWKYTEHRKIEEEVRKYRDHLEELVQEGYAELTRSEARYRMLFDKGNDAILVHELIEGEPSGKFTDVNEIACSMFGYTREEFLKLSPADINTEMDIKNDEAFLEDLNQLSHNLFERTIRAKDKKELIVEISAHIFKFLGKKTVISIIRDISERKTAERELVQAREMAEDANRSKSLFLSNMSHEIRTPLNAILGFSELLMRESALTGQQGDWLQTIKNSGEHLVSLINDILDVSKIEAGRAELNPEVINLRELLNNIKSMFIIKTDAKGILLTVTVEKDVPHYIETDAGKLRQILINLTGNAVKFTDKGSVSVSVYMDKNAGGSRLIADVEDTGPGIPGNELDHLFGTFEQSSEGIKKGGTGLGLYISRKYARMMGGDITISSTPGKGSCFSLELTIKEAQMKNGNIEDKTGKIIGLEKIDTKYRIMIADDEPANLQLLRSILKQTGFEIIGAVDGKQAFEYFIDKAPDLVFLDIRMPEMNGYEVIEKIRSNEKDTRTPIIALTASAFDEEKNKILERGADGYIRKPFKIEEIFKAVHAHLAVPYIYSTAESRTDKKKPVSLRKEEPALPKELIESLLEAAKSIDLDRVLELVDDAEKISPLIAEEIRQLAHAFQYETLIKLLNQQGDIK
ncbi:MAG: PAS domain S-box protein [Brevinematales bacterium]|nr:PAS domain S-box protein [Brevinematales bacterium]